MVEVDSAPLSMQKMRENQIVEAQGVVCFCHLAVAGPTQKIAHLVAASRPEPEVSKLARHAHPERAAGIRQKTGKHTGLLNLCSREGHGHNYRELRKMSRC